MKDSSWQKLETLLLAFICVMLVVFVPVSLFTYSQSQQVMDQIEAGNCSYLVENDVVERYSPENFRQREGKNFSLPEENQGYGLR